MRRRRTAERGGLLTIGGFHCGEHRRCCDSHRQRHKRYRGKIGRRHRRGAVAAVHVAQAGGRLLTRTMAGASICRHAGESIIGGHGVRACRNRRYLRGNAEPARVRRHGNMGERDAQDGDSCDHTARRLRSHAALNPTRCAPRRQATALILINGAPGSDRLRSRTRRHCSSHRTTAIHRAPTVRPSRTQRRGAQRFVPMPIRRRRPWGPRRDL